MDRIRKMFKILPAGIPLLLLILPKSRIGGAAAVLLWLSAGFLLSGREERRSSAVSLEASVLMILLSTAAGLSFYARWQNSARMKSIAAVIGLPGKQCCALLAALLCLAGCLSLRFLLRYLPEVHGHSGFGKAAEWLFILILAFVTITLASNCSPLYPFNDWVDVNTVFTVGKGMLRGKVPYRDLFDHKGPVLFAVHALAALISFDSLLGIYLIEIAACFFYLRYSYLILRRSFGRRALGLLPLLALAAYIPPAFVKGDSAEEICLPLLMYSIYIGIKALRDDSLPGLRECFFVGVTSSAVLWIKFNMLGFYFGWFLFFAVSAFRQKRLPELARILGCIFCGVAAASVPVLLYFGAHHALGHLWNCYFYNNLNYYPAMDTASAHTGILKALMSGLVQFARSNPAVLILSAAGMVRSILRRDRKEGGFVFLTLLFGFLVVFIGGTNFPYYAMIFGNHAVFGFLCLDDLKLLRRVGSVLLPVSLFICAAGILLLSENIYLLAYEKSDFPQYKVKDVLLGSGIEDPSLLHYGFLDAGFNLPAGLVPGQRYFGLCNLKLPEIEEEQERYLENAVPDFVVTCHEPLYNSENYRLLDSYAGDFKADGGTSRFFLYQRAEDHSLVNGTTE